MTASCTLIITAEQHERLLATRHRVTSQGDTCALKREISDPDISRVFKRMYFIVRVQYWAKQIDKSAFLPGPSPSVGTSGLNSDLVAAHQEGAEATKNTGVGDGSTVVPSCCLVGRHGFLAALVLETSSNFFHNKRTDLTNLSLLLLEGKCVHSGCFVGYDDLCEKRKRRHLGVAGFLIVLTSIPNPSFREITTVSS